MAWVLMAFDKVSEFLESEVPLPDTVDDDVVRSLVGDYPHLRGVSFPVAGDRLRWLGAEAGVTINDDRFDYFIESRRGEDEGRRDEKA